MVDIDERVVSMKFDSSDFEKKSKSTMSILDKLSNKLSFKDAADNNENYLKAISENVDKMAHKSYDIIDMWVERIKNNIISKFEAFLKENTIGQLQAGWSKYADMTTSIATLKGQGYAMEKITEQLERLNYFTDETSYQFTAMVGEIGKFTASGQSLEDATTAMMGIANWAAASGKNASEASRAMYQLSQALGAGTMRLIDYKSIQNLNMDTIEFRKNAIEAAIAVGTLKDNLDGTYTSLINNKVTFSIQNFAESLSQGKWFNSEVMMTTYKKYSEAVDDVRKVFEEGSFLDAEGLLHTGLGTTAAALKVIKKNNQDLLKKFEKTDLDTDSVNKLLSKWKKVEKVTNMTVKDYTKIYEISEDQAKLQMEEAQKNYAEYLKEYAEVFKGTEKDAEEALESWKTYVSEYGIEAFAKSQEAKTFREAIESAKDAASTVWTTIYTNVFGNYEEAKEIWTDLANALYEIFVDRLWNLNDIFEYWRSGGKSAMEAELKDYQKELKALKAEESPTDEELNRIKEIEAEIPKLEAEIDRCFVNGRKTTKTAVKTEIEQYEKELEEITVRTANGATAAESQRIDQLKSKIKELNDSLENGFVNGRKQFFQAIYAFGSGLKSIIIGFREGWDEVTEDNSAGKKLLSFSERLRVSAFRFYDMMTNKETGLASTDFYKDVAQGIKNLFSPFKSVVEVIRSVIKSFLPSGKTTIQMLADIARKFRELTQRIVPTRETLVNIARILRGIVAVIKFVGKVLYGTYVTFIKPILTTIIDVLSTIFNTITTILAEIADQFYAFEEGVGPFQAMYTFASLFRNVLSLVVGLVKRLASILLKVLAPIIRFLINSVKELAASINKLFEGGQEGLLSRLDKTIARIKTAWHSTESLADVFERFKGGKGISNFIEMLGEMFANLIQRIASVIAALFGFDEAVTQSKIGKGLQTIQEAFKQFGIVLSWLLKNVIAPTVSTIFQGIAGGIREIGDAWRKGDFLHLLEIIGRVIKTIGALELFKLIHVIAKIMGSGGLLRLIRQSAKTIKSIGHYFDRKALSQTTSSLLKFAIAITMVTVALVGLSYLPDNQFDRVKYMLLGVSVGLGILISLMAILTRLGGAENMWDFFKADPLESAARMFFGLTAAVLSAILAVMLLKRAFDDLMDPKTGKLDGGKLASLLISTLTPVIAVLTVLGIALKIISKFNIVSTLGGIAAIITSIAASVALLALSIKILTGVFATEKTSNIMAALGIVLLLLAGMVTASLIMAKYLKIGTEIGKKSSAFKVSIAMVALIASIALIVIPTLEDLVQNADKFPQYMAATALFVTLMLSLAGSMALMLKYVSDTKLGGIRLVLAGLAFATVAKVMQNYMLPTIAVLAEMGYKALSALPGVLVIGIAVLALAKAIQWICEGLSKVILAIGMVKPKQFIAMGASLAIVIGTIFGLAYLFQITDTALDVSFIMTAVGVIVGILTALGLFGKIMAKQLSNEMDVKKLTALFNKLIQLVGVILLGFNGILLTFRLYDKTEYSNVINVLSVFSGAVLSTIVITLGGLYGVILGLSAIITKLTAVQVHQISSLIRNIFIPLAVMVGLFSAGGIIAGLVYKSSDDFVKNVATIALSLIGTIAVFMFMVTNMIKQFQAKNKGAHFTSDEMATIIVSILGLVTIIGEAGLILFPAAKNLIGIPWETLAAAFGGIALVIASVLGMAALLAKASGPDSLGTVIVGIIGVILTLITMVALLPELFKCFDDVKGSTTGDVVRYLVIMLGPLAALVGLVTVFTTKGLGEGFILAATKIAAGLGIIALAIAAVSTAMALFREVFSPGTSFISGYFNIKGKADGYRAGAEEYYDAIEETDKKGQKISDKIEKRSSPSKWWKQAGKYNVQGLAMGMKQNQKLAVNASKGLAIATDEAFCEELGIESPSKVFYENGRFVVRGFINGVNAESNKNKQAGLDMAEGFSEGMDEAMEGIKDDFAGLWSDFGMDHDISEALKLAGADTADIFSNTLLDNLFGGSSEEEITQAQREENKIIENEFNNRFDAFKNANSKYQKAVEKERKAREEKDAALGTASYREKYNKWKEAYGALQDAENVALNEFLEESDKNLKKSKGNSVDYRTMYNRINTFRSKLSSTAKSAITGGLVDALTGAAEDPGLLGAAGGLLGGLFGGLGEMLGFDTSEDSESWTTQLGNKLNSLFGEGGDYNPDHLINNALDAATDYIKGETFGDVVDGVVDKATDRLKNNIMESDLAKFLVGVTGSENEKHNTSLFTSWWLSNRKNYNYTEEQETLFKNLVYDAIHEYGTAGDLEREDIEKYANYFFNTLGDYWKYAQEFTISKGLEGPLDWFDIGEGIGRFILPDDIFQKFLNTKDFNETLSNAFADPGMDPYGNGYSPAKIDKIYTQDKELLSLIENGFADGIGGTGTIELQKFVKYLHNSDGTFKKDLIDIENVKTVNGKEVVTFTKKGEYILKKAMEFAKTTDKSTYELDHDFSELLEYEKEYEKDFGEKVKNSTKNIEYQVNALLTSEHYSQYGHFSQEELNQLLTDLNNLNILGEDEFGNFKITNTSDYASTIIYYLKKITNDGLKVINDNETIFEPGELDFLKDNGITYESLKDLEKRANNGSMTAKAKLESIIGNYGSVDDYLNNYIQENWNNLNNYMNTTTYKIKPEEEKKYYKELRQYYKDNFSEFLYGVYQAYSTAAQEADEEARKRNNPESDYDYTEDLKNDADKKEAVIEDNKKLRQEQLDKIKTIDGVKDLGNFEDFLNEVMLRYPLKIEQIYDFCLMAMKNKWIEMDKGAIVWGEKIPMDMLDKMKEAFDEHSPSRKVEVIFGMAIEGGEVGIKQEAPNLLKQVSTFGNSITDTLSDSLDSTVGLFNNITRIIPDDVVSNFVKNGKLSNNLPSIVTEMSKAIEDENIKPTITPVYDDASIQAVQFAYDMANKYVRTYGNKTKELGQSFDTKGNSYDSKFDNLVSSINTNNTLMSSLFGNLLDTLQEGGLVDVNVIPEFDDTGLFNLVINKGKENWKRTGQQQFKW